MNHTFHIPVLGLGYSIDTPLKVARYGISSVVSIVDDELTERMRKYHQEATIGGYTPIDKKENDSRAKRITAYLNLLDVLVKKDFHTLQSEPFEDGTALSHYFDLLPDNTLMKAKYKLMISLPEGEEKAALDKELRSRMNIGAIDVNIMSKVDKANYTANQEYAGDDYTDALAAMRGFANSTLDSSVVISAGLNPRLYAYMERCPCFYPDSNGKLSKKIILKVSDFRSAMIQAKMLAKRGLWVSEFRVESGLNCGGHAFATEGVLLGPILEEFKQKRTALRQELLEIYNAALETKGINTIRNPDQNTSNPEHNFINLDQHTSNHEHKISNLEQNTISTPEQRITAQGGIGTAEEHQFLLNYYELDAAGWGSPFLLVPEATNVDQETLNNLIEATQQDYYLSNSSPLGVLFNNFKKSTAEQQRLQRVEKGRPGSPCTKKFLCTNTEFTEQPICTASREYQNLKIKQLDNMQLPEAQYQQQFEHITEKVCLCEGLCASTYIKAGILKPRENKAVSICPGPNLAFFSGKYALKEMINHIYGRQNLLSGIERPNMFVNELNLYVDYLKKDIAAQIDDLNAKKEKYFTKFKAQLMEGISYYRNLIPQLKLLGQYTEEELLKQLALAEQSLG